MSRSTFGKRFHIAMLALFVLGAANAASAAIPGVSPAGNAITLTAGTERITTPDGGSIYIWGFSTPGSNGGRPQYPAPTLLLNEGQTYAITVVNGLPAKFNQRVSLAVAGLQGVTAACTGAPALCVQGPITMEASTGGQVTYSFIASRPGTFLYNSASRPDLQVEMGLAGAMIVRPNGFEAATQKQAYDDAAPANQMGNPAGSQYEQEYLFFLSEMDSEIHDLIEQGGVQAVDDSKRLNNYWPNYWFINGRNAPDTMAEAGVNRLPAQPYNAFPKIHPGERLLMRVVGGGHEMHPFHHHGQHARVIAMDGFPLSSGLSGSQPYDLSHEVFTVQSLPGQTVDAIFRWTGKGLGWDVYGSTAADNGTSSPQYKLNPSHPAGSCGPGHTEDAEGLDSVSHEYCGDHGKPIPVILPDLLNLDRIGEFYGGSPFLGTMGLLPPGAGGLNPEAGYTYMWHSHNEKEITNFDIFPGGMMTMLMILPPNVPIE